MGDDTWTVRDPEPDEVEELAEQAGDTPEHEPGDDDWASGLEPEDGDK